MFCSEKESIAQHYRMLHTPVPRLVTKLSIPTIAAQLITVLYNTADTYFVAKIHTSAAAAVGVVFALMSIIHAFGFGIGMGAHSLISRRLGEKKDDEAHRYASSAFFAAFILGIVLFAGGELILTPLLRLLGATETILVYAYDYTFFILMGAPLMCSSFVLNNVLRAQGKTQFAMWGIMTGGILNIFLDPLFIFTFRMGIAGAAIATIISQFAGFLLLLSFFLSGKSIVRLSIRKISFQIRDYWLIFSNGIPTICRQGLGSLASAALNIAASGYGDAAVAAVTIANKVYMLVRQVVLGIGQGMQPAAGYNYGAGDWKRVRKIFAFSTVAGTVFCMISTALLIPFSKEIVCWFRPDADVVAIGSRAVLFCSAVIPLMAYSTFVNQLSQCLGFRLGATLLAACRQGIFFFPALFFAWHFFNLNGVIAVQPVADLCTFAVSVPYQIFFSRRYLYGREGQKSKHVF